MASLSYLWHNRVRHGFCTKAFFKSWAKRLLLAPQLFKRNFNRVKLVQKGAQVAETAELNHLIIEGNTKNLTVGSNSFLGNIEVILHDKVQIGNYVCINDDTKLLTASHDTSSPYWELIKKPIIIYDNVWIARSVIILPGITIGQGAVVAAGSVVTKNVAPYEVVAGNPAKVIKKRIEDLQYNPCEWLATNRAWLKS